MPEDTTATGCTAAATAPRRPLASRLRDLHGAIAPLICKKAREAGAPLPAPGRGVGWSDSRAATLAPGSPAPQQEAELPSAKNGVAKSALGTGGKRPVSGLAKRRLAR